MKNLSLQKIYTRERNEIKQRKKRIGALAVSLVFSLTLLAFNGNEDESILNTNTNSDKNTTADKNTTKADEQDKTTSKLTKIAGLEKAAENTELINPFKVDIKKSEPDKTDPDSKIPTPIPEFKPPTPPAPIKTPEPAQNVVMTLKGTAISGDKKMAIIQRTVVKNNSNKSDDKYKSESLVLNIGDEIDGRRIISINRNFVVFDDGKCLYLQEGQLNE